MPINNADVDLEAKRRMRDAAMVAVARSYDHILAAVATLTKNEKEQKPAINKLIADVNCEIRNIVLYANMGLDDGRDLICELLNLMQKTNVLVAEALVVGASIQKKTQAKKGADAKLANDPKQAAKDYVEACWQVWQEEPERYKGKTDFAREMLKLDQCKSLENQAVIVRWCGAWEKEASPS